MQNVWACFYSFRLELSNTKADGAEPRQYIKIIKTNMEDLQNVRNKLYSRVNEKGS